MTTIEQLLKSKGHEIFSVSPDDSVYLAIERMSEKGIGALVVLDHDKLVGMLSERDYARKVILQGKSSRQTRVGDIMTTQVICVGPRSTVDECMALLTEKHIRHLPVLQGGKLTGLVSIGDLVKEIISEKDFTIKQLQTTSVADSSPPRISNGRSRGTRLIQSVFPQLELSQNLLYPSAPQKQSTISFIQN